MFSTSTHDSGMRIFRAVGESRGEGGRAALIVVGIFTVIDRRVYAHGPHGGRIAVAIAIVLLTSIARSPDVDVSKSVTTLENLTRTNDSRCIEGNFVKLTLRRY